MTNTLAFATLRLFLATITKTNLHTWAGCRPRILHITARKASKVSATLPTF